MSRLLKCRTAGTVFKLVVGGVSTTITFDQGSNNNEAMVPDETVLLLLTFTSGNAQVYDPNPDPVKQATHIPVQNLAALKAIDNYLDQQVCLVEDVGLFRFDTQSVVIPDDIYSIRPDNISGSNPGRWIKVTENVESLPWGKITGTMSNQSDLNTALGTKANNTDLTGHGAAATGVHGVGTGTIAKVADIGVDTNLSSNAQDTLSKKHTHTNKALLDTYTQLETAIADAVLKKHDGAAQDTVIDTKALKVGADDVEITLATKGFIVRAGNGNRYRIKVSNTGTLSTELVP